MMRRVADHMVAISFSSALLLLLLIGGLSYVSTTRLLNDAASVTHTHNVIEHIATLRIELAEAETAHRSYLLTGEEFHLQPYEMTRAQIRQLVGELRTLTADNVQQHARLTSLETLIDRRFVIFDATVTVRREQGLNAVAAVVGTNQGYQTTSTIRSTLGAMEEEERTLLAQRAALSAQAANNTLAIIGLSSLLAIGIVAIASLVTTQANRARTQALAALCIANDELETQVQERTAELLATNQTLQAEVVERERVEQELRESEASFRLLFANNPHPMVVFDRETFIFLEVNDAARHKYGYTRTEFLQLSLMDIRPPEDVPHALRHIQQEAGKPIYAGEWRHLTRDGRVIDVSVLGHDLTFYGRPARLAIAHDITERKRVERERDQAEAALREREASFRLLFANNPLPMVVTDAETLAFLEVNTAAIEKYGYTRDEFLQMWLPDLRPPEDKPRLLSQVSQASGKQILAVEGQHLTKTGRIIDVEIVVHSIEFYGRSARLGVAHDITERKRVEAELAAERANMEQTIIKRTHELRRERDHTRAILEALSEAVLVADQQGTIQYLNPAATRLMGLHPDQAIGQHWWPWQYANQQETLAQMQAAVCAGCTWQGELINLRNDGTSYDAAITIAPLFEPEQPEQPTGFVSVQRDISLVKAAERLKDQFVSNVSHELRSPISLITLLVGSLEMLYARLDDAKRLAIIRDIRQHTRVLSDLIGDVLEISRIDSGRIATEQQAVNLALLMHEEVERMLPLALKKTQQLTIQGSDELPVVGHEGQLRQVIRNLLNNAIKYTQDGGHITCRYRTIELPGTGLATTDAKLVPEQWPGMHNLPPGCWAALAIADTGIGIAPNDLMHIFERFYRAQSQGDIPGTGLGLSIAWELVKRHGGYLEVSSTPGGGSCFAIYIPLQEDIS